MAAGADTATHPVDWRADWIWYGDDPAPYHCFLFARRVIELADSPLSATLHITATDRYRLYVNGRYLGRGPERCDPRWQPYDTHDLTALLAPGRNCIAVQAYFYGCLTGFTRDGRAGLLAQLDIEDRNGARIRIPTDVRWKVRPAKGWRRDAKVVGIGVGVTEVLDARQDPPDWMQPAYDDAGWEPAAIVPPSTGQWCVRLEPRHIPFLREEEMRPQCVLRVGEVLETEDYSGGVDVAEVMAREVHEELRCALFERPEALLDPSSGGATVCPSPHGAKDDVFDGIRSPFVLLDFGRQINAFPRISLDGEAGAVVDIAYGEQLVGGRIQPLICATRCADRYITRSGAQSWECFEYKSFRYLQVTVRKARRPIRLLSVTATSWSYPAPVKGAFECSDQTLSRLWKACALTSDLCTDDGFMDSPLREKRNWLGDGSHILLGVYAAFGDVAVIRRYFSLVTQGGLGDGMLREFFPGSDFVNEKTKIVGTIAQHALVWAARVWEYYWLYGDPAFLAEMYPTLVGLEGWCERHTGSDGLLERIPNWNWLDWTPADLRGSNFGTNAFYLHLLDDLSGVAEVLGRRDEAAGYAEASARVRALLRERFWHEGAGIFCDSFHRGKLTGIASELGNALALLFGIADSTQAPRILARLSAEDSGLAPATPLFHHYVLQGLCRAGCPEAAVELMRRRFGPMMEVSQTVWEGWSRYAMMPQVTDASEGIPDSLPPADIGRVFTEYRPCAVSLAHCGGVGAAFVLLTEILGIRPAMAGFGRATISPCVDLLDHADGAFPTGHGNIEVGWVKERGTAKVTVTLPAGVSGELRLERGPWKSVVGGGPRRPFAPGMGMPIAAGKTTVELT